VKKIKIMGIIREPLDIDFVVDPRPLSKKDREQISNFIKADKAKRQKSNTGQRPKTTKRKRVAI
jgi:hypothetical protein